GLIITVVLSSSMQVVLVIFAIGSAVRQATVLSVLLSGFMALYTGSPFWFLLLFVPSVQNCVCPALTRRRSTLSSLPSTRASITRF
ncbi:hypothetical protein PMAYCL1PPCAC_22218, partial [Pristionchus mayeri]